MIFAALVGWRERGQHDVIEYLREENRVLKAQLHGRRMRLTATNGGAWLFWAPVKTSAPDARGNDCDFGHNSAVAPATDRAKVDVRQRAARRPGIVREIRELVVRMARENPGWATHVSRVR